MNGIFTIIKKVLKKFKELKKKHPQEFPEVKGNASEEFRELMLRPIITGLIVYAALRFTINNHVIAAISWHTVSLMAIFGLSLLALMKRRMNPAIVIALSGIIGVVLY